MPQNLFIFIILIISLTLTQIYSNTKAKIHNREDFLKMEVQSLKIKLRKEKLKNKFTHYAFNQFKRDVALHLPLKKNIPFYESNNLRTIASLVTIPKNEILESQIIGQSFKKAKKKFQEKKFQESLKYFQKFIQNYSFSIYIVEAYSFLIRSLLQLGKKEDSLKKITDMVRLFPHHSLTGYVLLELGDIYKRKKIKKEAQKLYESVLLSFSDKKLIARAKRSLKRLDL